MSSDTDRLDTARTELALANHILAAHGIVDGGRSYLERYIHYGIYRARPEVNAVVHSHAPDLIPFGVTDTQLLPLLHVSASFYPDSRSTSHSGDLGDTQTLI